jgi:DNA repair photolyase
VLSETANPFGLITRGPMIVRDLDVLADAARRAEVSVTFSVPTLDVEVWRLTEPGTASPRQRLRALEQLVGAGIRASVGMAPILPGISDRPDQLAEVVRAAREAGACGIWANVLYLQPGTREHFLESLGREWPELLPEYERLYDGRAYLRAADTAPVRDAVRELSRVHGIRDRLRLEPPPPDVQLSLAV